VTDAIDRLGADETLGPGWSEFLTTGRWVAEHGLPTSLSNRAVWCLVSAMVATTSRAAVPWARTLARLAGQVRCLECGSVRVVADVLEPSAGDEPVYVESAQDPDPQLALFTVDTSAGGRQPPTERSESIADAIAGFRMAHNRRPGRAQAQAQVRWRTTIDAVHTLCSAPGSALVVAGTRDAATLLDPRSGSQSGPPLPGAGAAVAAIPLPCGQLVVAAAVGNDLHWWDAATGVHLGASVASQSPIRSTLAVPMTPTELPLRSVEWLATLRDGRTVLASGDSDGSVVLWDPVSHEPVHTLLHRRGRPATTMTTVASGRPSGGLELVVVHDGPTLEVWSTATVHGKPSVMAPDPRKLTTIGHSNIVGAAAAPRPIGQHRPLLLADRSGLVSMWMTFGIRLNDPLPPDPNHRDVVAIAVAPGDGDDFTVVTASRADRNLPPLAPWPRHRCPH
jgi:hypothetical protein